MTRRHVLGAAMVAGLAAGVGGSAAPEHPGRLAVRGGLPLVHLPVVDVRARGAVGDGRTDDGDAIRRGLAEANSTGGTLLFPPGTYRCVLAELLRPAAGVTLAGHPGASTILLEAPGAADFVAAVTVASPGVVLDGLTLVRSAPFRAVLLDLGAASDFRLSRAVLDGAVSEHPDLECHGVKLPDAGVATGIVLADSTLTDLTYGLFATNASTATVSGLTVRRCTFTRNHNTDLEFNSPSGSMGRIRVTDCAFSDNDSDGFGVGLAHVRDALVSRCTFDRYGLEAVHVEDYSDTVTVSDCWLRACGLRDHSYIQVISGCSGVRVLRNVVDAQANTNPAAVVNALPGGTGPTAGGRPPDGPSDVLVQGNTITCSATLVPVSFQDVRGGSIRDNRIAAAAVDEPADAFRLLEDPGTTIAGNVVNGRRD